MRSGRLTCRGQDGRENQFITCCYKYHLLLNITCCYKYHEWPIGNQVNDGNWCNSGKIGVELIKPLSPNLLPWRISSDWASVTGSASDSWPISWDPVDRAGAFCFLQDSFWKSSEWLRLLLILEEICSWTQSQNSMLNLRITASSIKFPGQGT